ncbi:MAG: adenosine deaminase [Actinomycetota bacterium]|nr:MAG: adenosine deaminase [Actinomycetota bacterium]
MPKAELHVHLEGTLEPGLLLELAGRHRVVLPYRSPSEVRAAYRFSGLPSFLELYYRNLAVLRDEEDFRRLTLAYLERAADDGVRHAEVFFDAQSHTARGVPLGAVIEGIWAGLAEGERLHGMSTRLIMCFLRDRDVGEAERTLTEALAYRGRLAGVGLDSAERGHPPGAFAGVFARARAEGLAAVAHAGEEGPAGYVREALDELRVRRIDHGVHVADDPELVERLRRERVPLTMCPLSNVKLGVVPRLEEHPLKRLLDAGLVVTVNSDDPAYFGGYIVDNLVAAQEALGLRRRDLVRLARNSFEAALLDGEERRRYLAEIDAFAARRGVAV